MAEFHQKAFALGVERILERRSADEETAARFRGLASDPRMRGVWDAFEGHAASIDVFLSELAEAVNHVSHASEFRAAYDQVGVDENAVAAAVDVLVRYCARERGSYPEAFLPRLGGLEAMLLELERFARVTAMADRVRLGGLVPTSRKARPDFLWRVHFAQLMVRGMLVRFRRPGFQQIADTMNVLCDFAESEQVTADSVRNAWRRNELHVRRAARPQRRRRSRKPAVYSPQKIAAE